MRQKSSKFELADTATAINEVFSELTMSVTRSPYDLGAKTVPEQTAVT